MEAGQLSQTDRSRLREYLRQLQELLDLLIRPKWSGVLFSHRTYSQLSEAYTELKQDGHFDAVETRLDSQELVSGLLGHGLSGSQLEFKVGFAERTGEKARRRLAARFIPTRFKAKACELALGAADIVGDSLASVVPGAGAIKEVKDGALVALKEGAPVRQRLEALGRVFRGRPEEIAETEEEIGA